jgi:hypothetical protein
MKAPGCAGAVALPIVLAVIIVIDVGLILGGRADNTPAPHLGMTNTDKN